MARKKVNLQWIADDATRRATLQKRRRGLMKKASELTMLCDVKACVMVYNPGETQPEVWPNTPEATSVMSRFKSMSETEQCKKMLKQEDFLRQRITKLQKQLENAKRKNDEIEIETIMYNVMAGHRSDLKDLSIEKVTCLGLAVDRHLKAVEERIEHLRTQVAAATPSPPLMSLPPWMLQPPSMSHVADVNAKTQLEALMEQQSLFGATNLGNVFSNGFGDAIGSSRGGGGNAETGHAGEDVAIGQDDPEGFIKFL